MSDYHFKVPRHGVQEWHFDGEVLTSGAVAVPIRQVVEMNLRRGIDNAVELRTSEGLTRIPGPRARKPGPSATWMALTRDLIKALPADAAFVYRPSKRAIWAGYLSFIVCGAGGLLLIANTSLPMGMMVLFLAMGLFLGWAFGVFSGTVTLDRETTIGALDRVTVVLERLGHAAPGAGVTHLQRKAAFKDQGKMSSWPHEPEEGRPWPIEEAYRAIWTDRDTVLVVTDGLTARFENGQKGLPYELAMELPELGEVEDLAGRTEFELLRALADKALAGENLDIVGAHFDIPCDDPDYAVEGRAGLLVGAAADQNGWSLLPILVLLPDELRRVRSEGEAAQADLVSGMAHATVSRPDRAPLLS